MDAKLRVVGGRFSGHTIPVSRGKLLIGRAEDCDLRPDSEFVSGYHCVLLLDEYTLRVRDLGSKNGTLVNGRRIGTGVTILLHDDMVSIGEMNILVDLSPAAETAPADSAGAPISPSALEGTGVFEGDTLQAEIVDVFPPPSPAAAPASANPNVVARPADEPGSRE
jgi:pSer/pThr/pTyr-binding forkhead associated (FHA) protein